MNKQEKAQSLLAHILWGATLNCDVDNIQTGFTIEPHSIQYSWASIKLNSESEATIIKAIHSDGYGKQPGAPLYVSQRTLRMGSAISLTVEDGILMFSVMVF